MTIKYYVGSKEIVTLNSIGMSVERYTEAEYWKVRLYLQDIFSSTVITSMITNKASCAISVTDTNGTVTFTGVVISWESTESYSYLDITNAICTTS
jgi:hypothetical protein